jgi:pimeloyl-ACP methyl ester carboxylesterase
MIRFALAAAFAFAAAQPTIASVDPFPKSFTVRDIAVDGASIHVREGGQGAPILLLHGFGDTGDMWQPLALALMANHTVIIPDLRGMGLSSHPETGYDKKTEANDMAKVLDALGIKGPLLLVTHDIGNMVGYAFIAQNRARVTRWVVMDAPLPGIGNWDEQLKNPKTWHFNFYGPDEERLVAGRERIYLDRFYNELSANPSGIDEATRKHYAALYARPHAMHDAFEQFKAFRQDAIDNQAFLAQGKLSLPVLAIGGDKSYSDKLAIEIAFVATNVRPQIIANAGHWLMEEQTAATVAAIRTFIEAP